MNQTLAASLTLFFVGVVSAQEGNQPTDPLLAAKTRLQAALEKTSSMVDTAFTASWSEDRKKKGDPNPLELAFAGRNKGTVNGSWHKGLSMYSFEGDEGDELLAAGRRTIAKDENKDWTLRRGRFADGNATTFLPDPELLLEHLASLDLTVVHRDVGSLEDRPVEFLTVTLNADQIEAVTYGGVIPTCLTSPMTFNELRFNVGGQLGARTAPTAPTSTVDLAIVLDPATGLVQQLRFRAWNKQSTNRGAGQILVARAAGGAAGAVQVAGQPIGGSDDEEEEEEEDTKASADGAKEHYDGGLPVRQRKQMMVMDYSIRLREHGKTAAPSLSSAQKKLLKL